MKNLVLSYADSNRGVDYLVKASHLILLVLGTSSSPIEGRTAIQKIVYFSSIKTQSELGYRAHFYGPYSPLVASALEDLVLSELVTESPRITIRDRPLYSYFLTEDGKKFVTELKSKDPDIEKKVSYVVKMCEDVTHNNINVLSWAAKIYFMLSSKGGPISYEDIIARGKKLGWQLDNKEIESGLKLLHGLSLARKSAAQ